MIRMRTCLIAVVCAAIVGWAAAMTVQSGASLRDEDDAYLRFGSALAITDPLARTELLIRLTRKLTPETLPGAIRAYRDDVYPLEAADIRVMMAYWAKHDARAMVEEVQSWPGTRVQRLAAAQAVYQIGETEGYEAARAFYDELPLHQRKAALNNLVLSLIDYGEIHDLAGFVTSFTDSDERETVAMISLHRLIRSSGPEAVQKWVEELPPGRGASSDLKRVAFRAAQSAHLDNGFRDEFIAWLERTGDTFWTKGGWRSIAVHWVRTDPMAAIEWARSLGPDEDREEVVAETIRGYAVRQADEAVDWILAQPAQPELDRGTGRLAVHYALERPDMTLTLMDRITSAKTFTNARRSVTHRWSMLPAKRREQLKDRVRAMAVARHQDASGDGDGDGDDETEDESDTTGEGTDEDV